MRRVLIGLLGAGALFGYAAGGYFSLFNSFHSVAQTMAGLMYDGFWIYQGGFGLVGL